MNILIDSSRKYDPEIRSSNPLIHLTDEWEKLKLIVMEGFRPNYSLEKLSNNNDTICAYFPMISTTNIPLQEALYSLKSYGTFGIVLDKKWGELNNFNPVLYFEEKSDLINEIINEFKNINTTPINEIENALHSINISAKSRLTKLLLQIFAHSKNFDGPLKRKNGFFSPNHQFGLERELRKVIIDENIPYFILKEEQTNLYTENLYKNKVDFKLEFIKAVIIEEDWQEDEIKSLIYEKYNLNSSDELKIEFQKNPIRSFFDEG